MVIPQGNVKLLGMPADDYHRVEALSQSGARKLLRSPAHYVLERTGPAAPTPAMQFGTSVHTAVLEPGKVGEQIAILPDVDRRTKEGKAAFAEFEEKNRGKIFLSSDDAVRLGACVDAVRSHPAAVRLLKDAEVELSLFWRDGKYDVPCKGRLDIRSLGGITDLKTTSDASPEAFARSAASFFYHCQAAHYFSGCEHVIGETPAFFAIIAVETEPPHAVAVYTMPSNAIMAGMRLMDKALARYAECIKSGKWQGYPDTIETLPFPRWATTFND